MDTECDRGESTKVVFEDNTDANLKCSGTISYSEGNGKKRLTGLPSEMHPL
jgi:hypothetical protein